MYDTSVMIVIKLNDQWSKNTFRAVMTQWRVSIYLKVKKYHYCHPLSPRRCLVWSRGAAAIQAQLNNLDDSFLSLQATATQIKVRSKTMNFLLEFKRYPIYTHTHDKQVWDFISLHNVLKNQSGFHPHTNMTSQGISCVVFHLVLPPVGVQHIVPYSW